MYISPIFKNEDQKSITEFIHQNGFALLISQVTGRPWATHLPVMLTKDDQGRDILVGHIAKANNQWKDFDKNEEVLVVFSGPHTYISSSWYNHENVPTWNYLAVHVYGKINIIEGEELKKQLTHLVDKYEVNMKNPVSVPTMSADYIEKQMLGIVGFTIEITEIQATKKLSQNRDRVNKDNIIDELKQQNDAGSTAIATSMKNLL